MDTWWGGNNPSSFKYLTDEQLVQQKVHAVREISMKIVMGQVIMFLCRSMVC